MPSNNAVYCGQVTENGQITSNGNFSCNLVSEYTIDYNGNCVNPVPVIALTSQNPMLTYVLNAYSGGFKLYIYEQTANGPVPSKSSFNFVVGEII